MHPDNLERRNNQTPFSTHFFTVPEFASGTVFFLDIHPPVRLLKLMPEQSFLPNQSSVMARIHAPNFIMNWREALTHAPSESL
jgi:hypothetical protein